MKKHLKLAAFVLLVVTLCYGAGAILDAIDDQANVREESYKRDMADPDKCRDRVLKYYSGMECAHEYHKLVIEDTVPMCRCQKRMDIR